MMLGLAACDVNNGRQIALASPAGPALSAGTGDTVMDVRVVRPPLSAVGLIGYGSSELGRVVVRFTGTRDGKAVLVRQDLVKTDADVAPPWAPVGVSSADSGYAAAAQPIAIALAPGEVLPLEGRRLTVRAIAQGRLDYTVE
jgi:hypothetical protein